MIIAGLWKYGDWRHVATGCNYALVSFIVNWSPSALITRHDEIYYVTAVGCSDWLPSLRRT